ncbi:MAG: hypothetical protein R3330_11735 [Saprospiraceae bacterium]|nr:hypothetical protein [Saprospiraceae bacterium]
MIELRRLSHAHWVMLEPGDGTHYEFLVTTVPKYPYQGEEEDDNLFIASVGRGSGSAAFVGYVYRRSSLQNFRDTFPEVVNSVGDTAYRHWARKAMAEDHYIGYMATHSGWKGDPANPWTTVAAIVAGIRVMEEL